MGNRHSRNPRKLGIHKETLRKLQLRALSDQELRVVPGGVTGTCTLEHCGMPSRTGC
jgi:hypothetical protein